MDTYLTADRSHLKLGVDCQEIIIDLSVPRSVAIKGVNPMTRDVKTYLLRVTAAGRLILN